MTPIPQHRTKIVCTLGPATDPPGVLIQMLREGMDVARLNAVHDSAEVHRRRIQQARDAARRCGVPLAILLDLPGPKHRLGRLPQSPLELRRGQEIGLTASGGDDALPVADPGLLRDLKKGDPIYLADGTVRLRVQRAHRQRVTCRVEIGGTIRSGSGMNMPQTRFSVRLPSPVDRSWIDFACREKLDWLGISFVRTPGDVRAVRKRVERHAHRPSLIAKIEKPEALLQLPAIAQEADGLMVARGDLGVETPIESVPLAQKRIIREGLSNGRPVITATQMLESMVEQSTPTRAEVADVANAVLDGTDAVMLSAETAIGKYPVQAVRVLHQVLGVTEKEYPHDLFWAGYAKTSWRHLSDAMGWVACRLAADQQAQAIVIAPGTVLSSSHLARFRPRAIVLTIAPGANPASRENLLWGVRPVGLASGENARSLLSELRQKRLLKPSAPVITVTPSSQRKPGVSDGVQVVKL